MPPRSPASPPAAPGLRAAGIALAAACACTRASDQQHFPPISDRLEIVETIPAPGAEAVAPDAQIDFCFSGYLDPGALDDFEATLSSGTVAVDAELDLQLFAWRPPGAAVGASEDAWCPGSVLSLRPEEPLFAGVLYRVILSPSAVGWAGEQLDITTPGWVAGEGDPAFILEFEVGEGGGEGGGEPAPAPTLTDLFAPGQVFSVDNPICGCHREPGDLARARLDLSSPQAAFAGLVLPAAPRSTGYPMVVPRRPSESYLVQTLLRDDEGAALHGVLGAPMPPEAPLDHADMVAIVRWIETGALP